jgi:cephalosporin hydroxylase
MKEWWETRAYNKCKWMGYPVRKHPADIVIMQEILLRTKPELIIECGTHFGGSALFFVSVLRLLGGIDSHVITIDVNDKRLQTFFNSPLKEFVHFIKGSSVDPFVVSEVDKLSSHYTRVAVDLDSNHSYSHVKKELKIYSEFVTPEQYLICEDTCCDVYLGWKDGPHRAVMEFVEQNSNYEIDKSCEKLIYTHNPDGYLKRNKAVQTKKRP